MVNYFFFFLWYLSIIHISYIIYNKIKKENGITGQILVHADHELLKELNIQSVGTRLKILNSIYGMKMKYNVPIEDYDYIPKCIILMLL